MGPEDIPFLIVLGGVLLGVPLWGIIDAARLPGEAWRSAGQNKVASIILQIIFGLFGTIVYAMAVRPKVKEIYESQ